MAKGANEMIDKRLGTTGNRNNACRLFKKHLNKLTQFQGDIFLPENRKDWEMALNCFKNGAIDEFEKDLQEYKERERKLSIVGGSVVILAAIGCAAIYMMRKKD